MNQFSSSHDKRTAPFLGRLSPVSTARNHVENMGPYRASNIIGPNATYVTCMALLRWTLLYPTSIAALDCPVRIFM